jgi:choline dehydrogenase-like flavoprotein
MTKDQIMDVVIVGAGIAGAMMASRLAKGGKSVMVLDAGPAWNMGDLVSSQLYARRLKWGGEVVELTGSHPFGHNFNAGWGLGGAALHHYGTWPRLHEEDFEVKSRYGRGLDWPISYADLRPHYDAVQREVGVAGDAAAESWRPPGDPYPMPPLKTFRQAAVLKRGFDALGIRTAPVPAAINSVEYNNRPACIYDGWCDAGCPLYAMGGNPLTFFLPDAEDHGAVIHAGAMAIRVLCDKNGLADGVEYIADGVRHVQRARLVIIAANPVQTPRLLLNSAYESAPKGLANSSGLVGRYFMTHMLLNVFGLFDEDMENHMGVSSSSLISQDLYAKDLREGAFGSYQWLIAPALKPNDLAGIATSRADLIGAELEAFMRKAVRGLGYMVGMGEEMPHYDNRVELSEEKDSFGMPRARVVHGFDEAAQGLAAYMTKLGVDIMRAAGATEAWTSPQATAHMMGGTIMGKSAKESVTDSFGRTHDVRNLFLAGSGLFPTSGASNPTFTIAAITDRSAAHILKNWDALAR